MKQVDILLVGIGGYGSRYVYALMDGGRREEFMPWRVVGAVEVNPASCEYLSKFEEGNIPIYGSLEEFYANHTADLAIISTPIYLHREHTQYCVEHGSNVLCEKPLCASIEDLEAMERLSKESGKFIYIGYQMCFSRIIHSIKADIAAGLFGKPLLMKTLVHYPRDESYYRRNSWAGKRATADGRLVLDSPIHNAVAHHLHNMLFLLGDAPDSAWTPDTLQAELYRANPDVENFDTAALRAKKEGGPEVLFYTSHALPGKKNTGPLNVYRFEKATIFHDDTEDQEAFFAVFDDGRTKPYHNLYGGELDKDKVWEGLHLQKVWDCIEAVRGGYKPVSTVESAVPEVLFTHGALQSHPITNIPADLVTREGEQGRRNIHVEGLAETLQECFDKCTLPSELGASWATAGKVVPFAGIREGGRNA